MRYITHFTAHFPADFTADFTAHGGPVPDADDLPGPHDPPDGYTQPVLDTFAGADERADAWNAAALARADRAAHLRAVEQCPDALHEFITLDHHRRICQPYRDAWGADRTS